MPKFLPILIVDDNAISRTGLSLSLTHFGFRCELAEDGSKALALLEAGEYEYGAVLMDYHMDGMTGAQCTEEIRRLEKRTGRRLPILGITTDDNPKIRQLCLTAGMDDVLIKCCPTSILIATLKRLMFTGVSSSPENPTVR